MARTRAASLAESKSAASLHRRDAIFARFVVDDDDEDLPSMLFEAEPSETFLRGEV